MSRMGQGDGKARIGSRRECGNGVRNPFGKDGAPAGARTLDPLIIHHIVWDGRSDAGHKLNSGVYFYALETGAAAWRKAILIK